MPEMAEGRVREMNDSLAAACGWTLARTVVLCLLAWPVIVGIERWLRALPDVRRPAAFALLLLPFLVPELVVGYTYRNTALAAPRWAEGICAGLLWIRIIPVGVIALLASPPAFIGDSAIYCRWMIFRSNPWSPYEWWQLARCYRLGPFRRALAPFSLMSLVAFQEFELAALLQTASWTDWFIAAQRVGLERNEMIRRAVLPVVLQLPLLAAALIGIARINRSSFEQNEIASLGMTRSSQFCVGLYLAFALVCGGLIPFCVMGWNLPSGLMLLFRQPAQWSGLFREIFIALSISVCAGMTTWLVGGSWLSPRPATVPISLVRQALILPGLIGSLLLSLSTVVLFQQPWIRPLYDTPIPWALALIVWLLPRAVLLRVWVGVMTRTASVHVAQILLEPARATGLQPEQASKTGSQVTVPARRRPVALLFRLRDQPQILAMGILCYWAYLDLSTAYLLAPSGTNSGLVRLYNFMHFGRSAALSAESFLFFGIPIVATYLFMLGLKGWQRLSSSE